jgi:uncharacterized OB-fold protein
VNLEARGVLVAIATVYQHPKLPVPFVLGRVTLDAGLSIDARLTCPHDDVALGARMRGVLVGEAVSESRAELLDLRFGPETESS